MHTPYTPLWYKDSKKSVKTQNRNKSVSSDHHKVPVKFQKDRSKTVGVIRTRWILPIHFCEIRAKKNSKLKMQKKVTKNNFRILKISHAYLQTIV